jgi:hypothetical protein
VNYLKALKPYCLQSLTAARKLRTPLHHKTKDSVQQLGTGETEENKYGICGVVVKKNKINGLQISCGKTSIALIKEMCRTVKLPCL